MSTLTGVNVPEKLLALVRRYALQATPFGRPRYKSPSLTQYPEAWHTILLAADSSSGSLLLMRNALSSRMQFTPSCHANARRTRSPEGGPQSGAPAPVALAGQAEGLILSMMEKRTA
jgi:hypothetical protein